MTPKIARFLAEQQPATPCLVLDLDRVEVEFPRASNALPLAHIYYAVKANPARPVLERLVKLASRFDAASFEEVAACLAVGARPDAISFGNTIKKATAIRRAHAAGVSLFAFDWPRNWRNSRRMRPVRGSIAASWSERGRRLAAVAQVRHQCRMREGLMLRAGELGLDPTACRSMSAASRPRRAPTNWRSAKSPCCSPI